MNDIFYPFSVFASGAVAAGWNATPVTMPGHPADNLSNQEMFDNYVYGYVFEPTPDYDKLTLDVEVYLDEEMVARDYPRFLEQIKAGARFEVSTGIWGELVSGMVTGHEDKGHVPILTNITTNHLAIMLNDKGACSLEDGCGIEQQNAEADDDSLGDKIKQTLTKMLKFNNSNPSSEIKNCQEVTLDAESVKVLSELTNALKANATKNQAEQDPPSNESDLAKAVQELQKEVKELRNDKEAEQPAQKDDSKAEQAEKLANKKGQEVRADEGGSGAGVSDGDEVSESPQDKELERVQNANAGDKNSDPLTKLGNSGTF